MSGLFYTLECSSSSRTAWGCECSRNAQASHDDSLGFRVFGVRFVVVRLSFGFRV